MPSRRASDREFLENAGAPRRDAKSGRVRIVQAGNGTIHPIEAQYLSKEVHSLRSVHRPVIHAAAVNRVFLMIHEPMDSLKAKSP